jgi:hypothetical protein
MFVTVGRILPLMSPRNSTSRPGSRRETVIVPFEMPIEGFTRTSNTVPTRTSSVDDRTSRTSVCQQGSFRTSEMCAKTSPGGRAIVMFLSTLTLAPFLRHEA